MGNMYEIFPFDNTLVTMVLSGADLLKVLQHGITHDGFSSGQYYGVKVTLDDNNMIKTAALLDGTPIENDKYYSVSTSTSSLQADTSTTSLAERTLLTLSDP